MCVCGGMGDGALNVGGVACAVVDDDGVGVTAVGVVAVAVGVAADRVVVFGCVVVAVVLLMINFVNTDGVVDVAVCCGCSGCRRL